MKREMRRVRFLFSIICLVILPLFISQASAQQIYSRSPVLNKVTYDGQVSGEKASAPLSPAYMLPGMFYIMSSIEEPAGSTAPLIAPAPPMADFGMAGDTGSYRYGYAYSNSNAGWPGYSFGNTNLFGWSTYPFSSVNLLGWTGYALGGSYALFNGNFQAPWFNSQLFGGHDTVPPVNGGKPGDPIGQPNPAAVYCAENGGDYQITTSADGSQDGVCVFSDGSQCDGWAYYRGECQPSGNQAGFVGMDVFYCSENGGTIVIRTNDDGSRYRACVFGDGSECEVGAYYRGECQPAGGHNTMPPLDGGKPGDPIEQPDPAAVFCTENGGTYETRTDKDGGQYGVCVFDDGSECDAWVYFLGECRPSGGSSDDPQIMPPLDGGKPGAPIGMANPASVYCTENGGYSKIRTAEDGGQYGVCVFDDGTECDEWAYFRGECQPSDAPGMMPPLKMPALYYDNLMTGDPSILPMDDTSVLGMANPAAVFCTENGGYSKIRTSKDGSQYGVCVFDDGTECDEWDYFRGECQPSDAPGMMPPLMMPPRLMPPLYDGNLMKGDPSILPMEDTSVIGMANPAAVYCEKNGGTYEIRTDEDGSQSGVCIYSDGKEYPDSAFFKGEYQP